MLGVLLDHRYRVLETLSKGGFGQTYIAEDTRRPGNPKCLVKHLTPASHEKEFLDNARRLFQMEAVTLEQLGNHAQIPRLLAYFEDNAEFYLVQELVNGHPISREIIPGQPWNEPRILRLLHEVLKILVFVHDCGVIHRDIKPDNLLRRHHDQSIVLVDFGSVKQIRSGLLTQNDHQISRTISIGTIGYMATEQSRGKPRLSSDVYSLGIIGIQAATGLTPNQFQEDNQTGELIWRNSASQISAELAAILTKMVCYHFKDRYKSAQDALFDVERLLGIGSSPPIDSPIHGGWGPSNSNTVSPSQSDSSTSDGPLPSQAPVAPTALSLPENVAANGHADSEIAMHESQTYISDLPLTVLSDIPRIEDEVASESVGNIGSGPDIEQTSDIQEEEDGAIATSLRPNASPMTEMSLSPSETGPYTDSALCAASTVETEDTVESRDSVEFPHSVEPVSAAESVHLADPLEAVEPSTIASIKSTDSAMGSDSDESDSKESDSEQVAVALLDAESLTEQEPLHQPSPTRAESPMQRVRNNITLFRKFYVYGAMGLGLGLAVLIPSLNSWNAYRQELRLAQNTLQSAESRRVNGQYEDCRATAETIPETFGDLHQQALSLQGRCLLAQAEELAHGDRLKDAIALVQKIPPDTDVAAEALDKIDEWFGQILQIAENKYREQNLPEAINIASAVTSDSSLYERTQALIDQWQDELEIWEQTNEAFLSQQWEEAIAGARQISDESSLKTLADELIASAQSEIRRSEATRQTTATPDRSNTGRSNSSSSSSGQSTSGRSSAPSSNAPTDSSDSSSPSSEGAPLSDF